jgi:hypothetical protein
MSHDKKRALAAGTNQGAQRDLHGNKNVRMLGTRLEQQIGELKAAMDAAAADDDLASYKDLHTAYLLAVRQRNQAQADRLARQHLGMVERSVQLADYGLREIPRSWLDVGASGTHSWSTSQPMAGHSGWRAAA